MRAIRPQQRRFLLLLAAVLVVGGALLGGYLTERDEPAVASFPASPTSALRVKGTIAAVTETSLALNTEQGPVSLPLAPNLTVEALQRSTLDRAKS